MKANTNQKSSINISGAQRPIDVYFPFYSQQYPSVVDKIVLSVILLFLYFGVMGLVWIIPFPHPKWFSSYNGYFSWASFLIAALMYYWYKQSPILSYFLLLILFALSYGAAQLAEMSALIGPPVPTICGPIVIAALVSLFIITKKRSPGSFVMHVFRLPVWLAGFLGKAFGARI